MSWVEQMMESDRIQQCRWELLGRVLRACEALFDDGDVRDDLSPEDQDFLRALAQSLRPRSALAAAELFLGFAIDKAVQEYLATCGSSLDVFLWADPATSPLVSGFPKYVAPPEAPQVEAESAEPVQ